MRVYYYLSDYISHRQSGMDFVECLRLLGHEVVFDPEELSRADAAILHEQPNKYAPLFERLPLLRDMRTIAYSVWENEILPEAYKAPLGLVKEIWTPSRFSQQSMLPFFPHVRVLPHVVKRVPPVREDLKQMRAVMQRAGGTCRFFSVVDAVNPRKNIAGLLAAFALARRRCGKGLRLVLKQYRRDLDFSSFPGVVSISDHLSEGQMAALHALSDAYVSAHHAEGWGLGLSQAMAYGKPVIATGYSGNMDFMDAENSLPVPYRMVPVSEEMLGRIPLFTRDMQWAEPDVEQFASRLCRMAEKRIPPDMGERAACITRLFGVEQVSALLQSLLER